MGARASMAAPVTRIGASVWRGAVNVAGGLLHVTVAGDGPPLILLHGWTLDARMWQPQIAGLARGFMLVMPDRRGFGRSSAPPDLSLEAEDIARLGDFFKADRFHLAGLSQGASVALDTAARLGDRIAAVAVCGAPLPALVERAETLDLALYQRLALEGNLPAMRADWATHPLMQARSIAARDALAAMLADYDGRDLLSPSSLPDITPAVAAALAMPCLALVGEHDTPWRRACASALAAAVPQGTSAVIADAGHVANLDNPAGFDARLSEFLFSVSQQGASS